MPVTESGSPASPLRRALIGLSQWFDSDHIPEGREKLWAEPNRVDWVRTFPFVVLPLFFKYETLRYRFDDAGIAMSWGFLFRREIYLTYRRIQDIHLTRNILQRWMGLATVSVQTASGSATPEMSIEGIPQAAELRDFLYAKMRGGHDPTATPPSDGDVPPATSDDEVLSILHDIRDGLRQLVSRRGSP